MDLDNLKFSREQHPVIEINGVQKEHLPNIVENTAGIQELMDLIDCLMNVLHRLAAQCADQQLRLCLIQSAQNQS